MGGGVLAQHAEAPVPPAAPQKLGMGWHTSTTQEVKDQEFKAILERVPRPPQSPVMLHEGSKNKANETLQKMVPRRSDVEHTGHGGQEQPL